MMRQEVGVTCSSNWNSTINGRWEKKWGVLETHKYPVLLNYKNFLSSNHNSFMCQLDWASVLRCLVKDYCGWDLRLNQLIVLRKVSKPHPISWRPELNLQPTAFKLHLHHLLYTHFLLGLHPDSLLALTVQLAHPWVSSLPAHYADIGLARLHNCMSHFLKINLFVYTNSIGSVSLENPD